MKRIILFFIVFILTVSDCFTQDSKSNADKLKIVQVSRILYHEGLMDGFGHVSYRVGNNLIYITPFGPPGLLEPEEMLEIDMEGNKIAGAGEPSGETAIHLAVYRHNSKMKSVIHYHPEAVIAVAAAGKEVKPLANEGADLIGGTPIFDDPRLIRTKEQGDAMMEVMGKRHVVLLRGHGAVVAADMPEKACYIAVHLEKMARIQIMAAALGSYNYLSREEAEDRLLSEGAELKGGLLRFWEFYRRSLLIH